MRFNLKNGTILEDFTNGRLRTVIKTGTWWKKNTSSDPWTARNECLVGGGFFGDLPYIRCDEPGALFLCFGWMEAGRELFRLVESLFGSFLPGCLHLDFVIPEIGGLPVRKK